MNNTKSNGITLVALVVTIIILLILAGITISQLSGNGLFEKTNEAKNENTKAIAEEEMRLIVHEVQTEQKGSATLKQIVEKLQADQKNTYIVTTKTKIAILTTADGEGITDASEITDETENIYVTNIKYGHEVGISNSLKVSSVSVAETKNEEKNMVPLSNITEENYGEYMDLGIDIVATSKTTDDWRIFYKDENYVYVILADYLPTSKIPSEYIAKMSITVNSNGYSCSFGLSSANNVIETLLDNNNWDFLLTEKLAGKAVAIGSPSYDLFRDSWNSNPKVNDVQFPQTVSYSSRGGDVSGLYMFGGSTSPNCYILAGAYTTKIGWVNCGWGTDWGSHTSSLALRPVICLPLDLKTSVGSCWTPEI